jgi:hypothetical protein
MKYMLVIHGNAELWQSFSEEQTMAAVRDTEALHDDLVKRGEFVGAYGLADQVMAKTVRVRDGVPAVTDGPYLEAKEYLASFEIIDVESLDRALEVAAANPAAKQMQVEVWPILHESNPEG